MHVLWEYKTKNFIHRVSVADDENYSYSNGVQNRIDKDTGVVTEINMGCRYSASLDGALKIACKHITNEKEVSSLTAYIEEYRSLLKAFTLEI